jgi:hypothetical protein
MSKYEELFQEYVSELNKAVVEEEERLGRIKEIHRNKFQSEQELEEWVEEGFGNISTQGRIIAVFRMYWLKCDELNQLSEEDEEIKEDGDEYVDYVNPKDFVVDWLSGSYEELYEIIDSMPYYPIGIDVEGNYC